MLSPIAMYTTGYTTTQCKLTASRKQFPKLCDATYAGDGNCGYRAFAVGLIVAMAGLKPETRQVFAKHLGQVYSRMRQLPQLLRCSSPIQGTVDRGYYALLVRLAPALLLRLLSCIVISTTVIRTASIDHRKTCEGYQVTKTSLQKENNEMRTCMSSAHQRFCFSVLGTSAVLANQSMHSIL